MNRAEFERYLQAFNDCDFETVGTYLADDLVFTNLPPLPRLHGRETFLEFYRDFKSRVRETLVPETLFVDEGGIALEARGTFEALRDLPDFPAAPLREGDRFLLTGIIFYKTDGARFTSIRSVARLETILVRKSGETIDLAQAAYRGAR